MNHPSTLHPRRVFLQRLATGLAAAHLTDRFPVRGQVAGDRPPARAAEVTVLNPRDRVPLAWIIDDSTCLVNLNKFAIPQFATAWGDKSAYEKYAWRDWPDEIPDQFVRRFGEWCAEHGVKGKYSIVPYPACVGRMDGELPGWTAREVAESLKLVREVMTPNWDIHPEMVTHTRIIDTKTGHPYPERSLKFMENWEWTTGRSADEIAAYMTYALRILKNVGLPCEGITTPGGFGNRALPELARASLESVRAVYGAEVPHYFRHVIEEGNDSVAPRVEYAADLETADPKCVVSIIGCTGDWTGSWDNSEPEGPDRFVSPDLARGRIVDLIARGEPACLLSHWTGIYHNGRELGFKVVQEVVRRLKEGFGDRTHWMKLAELSRYWAARELTRIEVRGTTLNFAAPFACPGFTLKTTLPSSGAPQLKSPGAVTPLEETRRRTDLRPGTFLREANDLRLCFDLPKGTSQMEVKTL